MSNQTKFRKSFRLIKEKQTRNTVVYNDIDGFFTHPLYFPKDVFPWGESYPTRVTLTIEENSDAA